MARDVTDATPIESRDQLIEALSSGAKPRSEWRVGTEHEKFGFYEADDSPVPYEGERGIRRLLELMEGLLGWHRIEDRGLIIGLGEKLAEVFFGPLVGGAIENWFAYVLALMFLLVRPQGLFGEKIIERI